MLYNNTNHTVSNVSAHIPSDLNLSNPEKYGLEGVRNFHVTTDDNITLGVWQILPENLINSSGSFTDEDFDRVLDNGQDVIIYNHGNSGTRATKHRVEMYKVLRKYFHVITYDYRSKYVKSCDITLLKSRIKQNQLCDCRLRRFFKRRSNGSRVGWRCEIHVQLGIKQNEIEDFPMGSFVGNRRVNTRLSFTRTGEQKALWTYLGESFQQYEGRSGWAPCCQSMLKWFTVNILNIYFLL